MVLMSIEMKFLLTFVLMLGCNILTTTAKPTTTTETETYGKNTTTDRCQEGICGANGHCSTTTSSSGYECICDRGYIGEHCDNSECSSKPCQRMSGERRCILTETFHFSCPCAWGVTGETCEDDICTVSPCNSNQTCSSTNDDPGYSCACRPGYHGDNCEYGPCQHSCSLNGVCEEMDSSPHFHCTCNLSYTGSQCEQKYCEDVNPCDENQVCKITTEIAGGYICCKPGYTGQSCSISPCSRLDCNNGTCEEQPVAPFATCSCEPPFTGPNCTEHTPTEEPTSTLSATTSTGVIVGITIPIIVVIVLVVSALVHQRLQKRKEDRYVVEFDARAPDLPGDNQNPLVTSPDRGGTTSTGWVYLTPAQYEEVLKQQRANPEG